MKLAIPAHAPRIPVAHLGSIRHMTAREPMWPAFLFGVTLAVTFAAGWAVGVVGR